MPNAALFDEPIFVWRSETHHTDFRHHPKSLASFYNIYSKQCDFCGHLYSIDTGRDLDGIKCYHSCSNCGYKFNRTDFIQGQDSCTQVTVSVLRKYDLSSPQVLVDELGSYLKTHPDAISALSPRRFEELVDDVFKNNGFTTHLTQQTRDGGFDLRIIENRSGEVYLVECKKYSNNNPIGIAVVRQMLGVQLLIGIHRAKIVTTSRFSKNAVVGAETAEKLNPKYELELIDAVRFLDYLGVYNTELPRTELMSRVGL